MLTTASGRALRITTSGSLLVLHKFEGGWPFGGLILARDGMFFGTTRGGAAFGAGTVFKMSETGTVTTLHDFAGGSEGELPYAAPIQSVKGDFYGTTSGNDSLGTPPFGSATGSRRRATSLCFTLLQGAMARALGGRWFKAQTTISMEPPLGVASMATAPSSGSAQAVNSRS